MFFRKIQRTDPKILILADTPGWIVDEITNIMVDKIPFHFHKEFYAHINSDDLLKLTEDYDIIHYQNWDLDFHKGILDKITKPMLVSIRSHKYPKDLREKLSKIKNLKLHVIGKPLLDEFPEATYIPDGFKEIFKPAKKFIVGFSGEPSEYKGFPLIEQACKELNVEFKPAKKGQYKQHEMPKYYRTIDLLVSASEAEGHCAPVVECMAMNIPVITTNVGAATELNLVKIERNVESIKNGILKFYTRPQVAEKYDWNNICKEFSQLYLQMYQQK